MLALDKRGLALESAMGLDSSGCKLLFRRSETELTISTHCVLIRELHLLQREVEVSPLWMTIYCIIVWLDRFSMTHVFLTLLLRWFPSSFPPRYTNFWIFTKNNCWALHTHAGEHRKERHKITFKCSISERWRFQIQLLRTWSCRVKSHVQPGRSPCTGRRGCTAIRRGPGASCLRRAPPRHSARSWYSCPIGPRCRGWRVCRRNPQKQECHWPGPSEDVGTLKTHTHTLLNSHNR